MKNHVKQYIIIVSTLTLAGCAKLSHLDQLLTLKDLSDEQDRLAVFVEEQDKRFEKLLAAYADKTIEQYQDQKSILKAFGEPVWRRSIQNDQQPLEQWLYRYSTQFFDSPKVYFYFDEKGKVVKWEYVQGNKGQGA